MNKKEVRKCPKCSGEMVSGEAMVGYGYWGFRLRKLETGNFIGDKIIPFYCKSCGYIEFYKEMKNKKIDPTKTP
jgi:predicted nucleic-acid-binding Zn-ribbon protein